MIEISKGKGRNRDRRSENTETPRGRNLTAPAQKPVWERMADALAETEPVAESRAEYDAIVASDPEMRRTFEEWLKDREYLAARYDQGFDALVHYTVAEHKEAWETRPEEEIRRIYLENKSGLPGWMLRGKEPAADLAAGTRAARTYGVTDALREAEVRAQMAEDYGRFRKLDYDTVRWLSVSDNLKVARDDAEALDRVNAAVKSLAFALSPEKDSSLWLHFQRGVSRNLFGQLSAANNLEAAQRPFLDRLMTGMTRFAAKYLDPSVRIASRNAFRPQSGGTNKVLSTSRRDRRGARGYGGNADERLREARAEAEARAAAVPDIDLREEARNAVGDIPVVSGLLDGALDAAYWLDEQKRRLDRLEAKGWRWLSGKTDPGAFLSPRGTWNTFKGMVAENLPYTLFSIGQFLTTQAASNAILPGSGFFVASASGINTEASMQAGGVREQALDAGMSHEEAMAAASKVYWNNVALLAMTDPLQNYLTFGGGKIFSGWGRYAPRIFDWAVTSGFEGFEEFSQDWIDDVALGREHDWEQMKWSTILGATMGGMQAGIGGGMRAGLNRLASEAGKAKRAEAARGAMDAIIAAARDTKTAERMPEALEDFTRQAGEGTISDAWIDGEVLYGFAQAIGSATPEELSGELGVDGDDRTEFAENMKAGSDVRVDAAKLIAKMAKDPARYEALRDHLKFSPTDMSAAEGAEAARALPDRVKDLVELNRITAEKLEREAGAAARFARELKEQFRAVVRPDLFGRKGERGELYADLFAARMIRRASDLGVSVEELLEPGVFKVTGDAAGNVKITLRRGESVETLEEYAAPPVLGQAMYMNPAKDIVEFRNNVVSGKSGKSYFEVTTPAGTEVDIAYSNVKHFHGANGQALSDAELTALADSVENIQEYAYTEGTTGIYGGQLVLTKIDTAAGKFGAVFEHQPSGRVFVTSAFKSTDKGIDAWIKKEGAHALAVSKTFKQGQVTFSASQPSVITTIQDALGIVKETAADMMKKAKARRLAVAPAKGNDILTETQSEIKNDVTARDAARETRADADINTPENQAFDQMRPPSRAKLDADIANWAGEVDSIFAEDSARGDNEDIRAMSTPLALSLAGARLLPVYMSAGKMRSINESSEVSEKGHDITPEDLKQLPEALADPIMIFESATVPNSLVALVEIKGRENETTIVPFHLEVKAGEKKITANRLTNVYGKDMGKLWIEEQIDKGRLRYINEKKASKAAVGSGLQLSKGLTISKLAKMIPNENDLVNLWDENPTLYQYGDEAERGNIAFLPEEAVITLFETADPSTLLHEMGHFFLQDIFDLSRREGVNESVKRDWEVIAREFGLEGIDPGAMADADAKRWADGNEKFAASFEAYLREGNAPSAELKNAFRHFKDWLVRIYKTVKGIRWRDTEGNFHQVELNDGIRAVFDRMLAVDAAIEERAAAAGITALSSENPLAGEAVASARERLQARVTEEASEDERTKIQALAEKKMAFVRGLVAREARYRAILGMRADPALRLDTDEFISRRGENALETMPDGLLADGGAPIDAAAAGYGYASADEFIDDLMSAPDMETEVARRALEEALREAGRTTAENLSERADEAIAEGDEATNADVLELMMKTEPDIAEMFAGEETDFDEGEDAGYNDGMNVVKESEIYYPDNLGRDPADVARRFELARDREISGGTLQPGGDTGVNSGTGEQIWSGELLGEQESPPGAAGTASDVLNDDGMNIPGKAWPEGFPDVTTIADYKAMKGHTDYAAAKTGNTEAAVHLIHDLMDESSDNVLMEIAAKYPDAILVSVHAVEAEGKNKIPEVLVRYISELTGMEADESVLQSNVVAHTGAGQNERLFNRPKFEGEIVSGRNYIIVDDMVTMGSTIGELRNYIEHNGGSVADVITLSTRHDNNRVIALKPETRLALEKTFGVELDDGTYDMTSFNEFLKESEIYGGRYEALTESEARALLSAKGLDEARNRRAKTGQNRNGASREKTLSRTRSDISSEKERSGVTQNGTPTGTAPGNEGGSAFEDETSAQGWEDFDAGMDAFYIEDEAAQAERESPLSRKNLTQWIKDHGGLSYQKLREGFGSAAGGRDNEARALLDRGLAPGVLNTNGRGIDELAQGMEAEGIPVRDGEHLYMLLMAADPAKLTAGEAIYEKGVVEGIAKERKRAQDIKQRSRDKKTSRAASALFMTQYFKSKRDEIVAAAQHMVGVKRADDAVDPRPFRAAARKYERLADKAYRENRMDDYVNYKNLDVLNREAARQADKARKGQDDALHSLRKYANRPWKQSFGVDPRFLEQIDAMLERVDLRRDAKFARVQDAPVPDLHAFVKELEDAGVPVFISEEVMNQNYRKHWTKMTHNELMDLRDTIKSLEHAGKFRKTLLTSDRNRNLDQVVQEIVRGLTGYFKVSGEPAMTPGPDDVSWLGRLKDGVDDFSTSFENVESLLRAIDGYKDLGPAHQYIFQPIRDAISRETSMMNDVFARVRDLVVSVYGTDSPRFADEKMEIAVPEMGTQGTPTGRNWTVTRAEMIAALLNFGNEGNWQRFRDGWFRGVTGNTAEETATIREGYMRTILASAEKRDLDFVQGLWDIAESLRPLVKQTHEILTGVAPKWVEPKALDTAHGLYRGGYWPAVADPRYSERAARWQEEEKLTMDTIALDHMRAETRNSHRKARARAVMGRPLLLSLGVIDNHLTQVIHDAALAPALRDVNMIIKHPVFMDAVKQALGDNKNKLLNHWLRAVGANNKNNGLAKGTLDGFADRARLGAVAMGLGANIAGGLLQVTGYIPLASKLGPLRTARAILRGAGRWLIGDWGGIRDEALAKSEFMREQVKGQDRELREMTLRWSARGRGRLDAVRSLMMGQYAFFQNMCNIPGWLEAYKKGLGDFGGDEVKAVRYADMIIRTTQSASSIADLTRMETGGTLGRLFTMFYSWFRVQANLNKEFFRRLRHEPGGLHKLGLFANWSLFVLVMPRMIERLMRTGGPDEDEGETWPRWLMREAALGVFLSPLESVPIVRDVTAGVAEALLGGRRYGGYRMTPVANALDSAYKLVTNAADAANDIFEGEEPDWGRVARDFANFGGYAAAMPVTQAMKWYDAAADAMSGEDTLFNGAYRIVLGRRKKD
jgi:hypothetical protein